MPLAKKHYVSKALKDSIESVVQLRLELLKAGDVSEAKRIRDQLLLKGVALTDSQDSVSGSVTTKWEIRK